MSPVDYPAAHSADTAWFAVDRDGRVAVFDTGEDGAVPVDAYEEGIESCLEDLPERGEAVRVAPVPAWPREEVHRASGRSKRPAVFHLRDRAALAPEVEAGRARRVPGTGAEAFMVDAPTQELVERLHAGGHCLGCRTQWEERSPAAAGVYSYVHVCDALAGPYRQVEQPAAPLRLEDLPKEVRARTVTFDGRFAETPLLQPLRHWPCDSWGSAWLDLDGKTVRPVPGREDGYDEHAGNLAGQGFEFDPPPQPVPPRPAHPAPAAARPARPWWKLW